MTALIGECVGVPKHDYHLGRICMCGCGAELVPHPKENTKQFNGRVTCSGKCRGRVRTNGYRLLCQKCGTEFGFKGAIAKAPSTCSACANAAAPSRHRPQHPADNICLTERFLFPPDFSFDDGFVPPDLGFGRLHLPEPILGPGGGSAAMTADAPGAGLAI